MLIEYKAVRYSPPSEYNNNISSRVIKHAICLTDRDESHYR